ncbi:MAG TPA: hypothetical protein VKA50_00560 [Gammaproteobacteria bacterium]|nr:hypothetical protein [Gammaproteobacteria bacterium]
MSHDSRINRRGFVRLCASAMALVGARGALALPEDSTAREYHRVRLVDADGNPFRAGDLEAGRNYIFHYPYISTPCFLLNLGEPVKGGTTLRTKAGQRYTWRGGIGPKRSIVAFSAICSHRMTYPAHAVSFINYRANPVNFRDENEKQERRDRVIYCCSEKSVYDATAGARVLGGPAPQPLAAILLDYEDREDGLYARGTYGGTLFHRFFDKFGFHLSLEYVDQNIRHEVTDTATVVPLDHYSRTQVLC